MPRTDGNETKKKYIETAYCLIKEHGIEHVTVRDIARKLGCTAPALYKHFENQDNLMVMASLRFLDNYVMEIEKLYDLQVNPVEMNLKAWYCFNKYAFASPPMFLNMFWGKSSEFLENILYDYFELYPLDESTKRMAMYCAPLFSGSIEERDFIWMRRGAAEGLLRYEDAQYLSRVNTLVVRSMLLEHMEDYKEPGVAEAAAQECSAIIEKTTRKYLLK